jgi:alpha-galactosidase/6-phospho-beta-glucosidase family protein
MNFNELIGNHMWWFSRDKDFSIDERFSTPTIMSMIEYGCTVTVNISYQKDTHPVPNKATFFYWMRWNLKLSETTSLSWYFYIWTKKDNSYWYIWTWVENLSSIEKSLSRLNHHMWLPINSLKFMSLLEDTPLHIWNNVNHYTYIFLVISGFIFSNEKSIVSWKYMKSHKKCVFNVNFQNNHKQVPTACHWLVWRHRTCKYGKLLPK